MIFGKAVNRIRNETVLTLQSTDGWDIIPGQTMSQSRAMKVSTVNRCVEVLSDSIAKLPMYVMNSNTKEHLNHWANPLLKNRPNSKMSAFVFKKLLEVNRLMKGNAYVYMRFDGNGKPCELIPLVSEHTFPYIHDNGVLWYISMHPVAKEYVKFHSDEIIHLKGYSEDGITGISILSRAAEVINTGQALQTYENKFYSRNGRPSGVLKVASKLDKDAKDKIRTEWGSIHEGADNSFRIAVLDLGLEYQQIGMSQKDAQFIESKIVGVEDICRFFGVPLHKVFAGKQSYSSNEQNAIEYVTGALHPVVKQYEEEFSYKMLFDSEINRGIEIKINMAAELRGDNQSRANYYKTMREIGAYSVNDILDLEDRPKVPGGDTRYASLNYVPLEDFKELSQNRNEPTKGGGEEE